MVFDDDVIAIIDLSKDNSTFANYLKRQLLQKQAVVQYGEKAVSMLIFTKEAKTAIYLLTRSAGIIQKMLIKDGYIAI